jgi:simple sugar transport system permease protein
MVPSGSDAKLANWKLPSEVVINALAFACAFFGGVQLARSRGFGKRTNTILALVAGSFIFAFLVWAAADKSLNLAGLLNATLQKAVPLTLGALSGILCERAGVVNIAIEGMMLGGAMVSTVVASVTGSLWLGVSGALCRGAAGMDTACFRSSIDQPVIWNSD